MFVIYKSVSYADLKTPEERRRWAEERLEEKKACSISDRELEILERTFALRKTEFSDLDDLRWADYGTCHGIPERKSNTRKATDTSPFIVLTNDELSSFSGDETIRLRSLNKPKPSNSRDSAKPPRVSVKKIFEFGEQNNEYIEDDSAVDIPYDVGTEESYSTPTPASTLILSRMPSPSSSRGLQRTNPYPTMELPLELKGHIDEVICLGRPTTPTPYSFSS